MDQLEERDTPQFLVEDEPDHAAECQLLVEKLALLMWYSTKWIARASMRTLRQVAADVQQHDVGATCLQRVDQLREWIVLKADQMLKEDLKKPVGPDDPSVVFSDAL